MPYICIEDRKRFESLVDLLNSQDIRSPGDLNYLITMIVHKYLNGKPESYQMYNDAVGALEGAKLELYRRHVAEYEQIKIKENGDV